MQNIYLVVSHTHTHTHKVLSLSLSRSLFAHLEAQDGCPVKHQTFGGKIDRKFIPADESGGDTQGEPPSGDKRVTEPPFLHWILFCVLQRCYLDF